MSMIGKILGHYRIGEQLGRGGMGEVYMADDLSLNRKVALKFLPDAFTGDPERMARFEREAKLLASLNHPNIAAIYGLEQAEGKRFLVLELVEGETLAQRLGKGPLSVEEALKVCRQIIDALEAAHEKGVIHRDLKPANVMITEGDRVKILDFGLAKALADETQSIDSSHSPTITEAMTRPGVILGTAAYMSPEQAKGKAVDKRADIWAFGCILYECLTGKRVFEGETISETLAAILKGEPDWKALPATTPPSIRFVLRRCLEKDAGQRLRDAADVRIQIEETQEIGEPTARMKHAWLAWSIAAVFIAAFAVLSFVHFSERRLAPSEPVRFQIAVPEKTRLDWVGSFAMSPDGRHLAFSAAGSDGVIRLWIRALDSLEARPLIGTESDHIPPFSWSPDSRFIAYGTGGKLRKIDIAAGPAQTICDIAGYALGNSWNRDGVIIFGTLQQNILKRVSAAGGTATPLTKPDPALHISEQKYPVFLPDGRHFLYWQTSDSPETTGVYLGSLDSKLEEQGFKRLLGMASGPLYVPPQDSGPGQILFLREQTLMSQGFDDKRLELVGEPIPLAENVRSYSYYGTFSASTNGILVYRSGGAVRRNYQAVWFDRQGKSLGASGEPGELWGLALSPDAARAAVSLSRAGTFLGDIWLLDFARKTKMRFTFGQGDYELPIWSPDGNRIIFTSKQEGEWNLYQKVASGVKDEELLLKSRDNIAPTSWSSDGRFLLYTAEDPKTKCDLWVLPMEGDHKPVPFLRTEFNESDGRFSPEMRWVAYQSDESGSNEIYVREFSKTSGSASEKGGKWQVSVGGGTGPRWRRDGKELYYRAPDGKVMVVSVTAGTVFQSGTPIPLFQAPTELVSRVKIIPLSLWDVTPDGNRFLLSTPAAEATQAPFTVILDWTALLKK